jgi:hypothetical protein
VSDNRIFSKDACTVCGRLGDPHAEWCAAVRTRLIREERVPAPCGTNAGYQRHLRRGEPTCADCRATHSARMKAYYRRTRARRSHVA